MSDVPQALTAALADRYALDGVIGRGGMATVYGARDLKHGRAVAVKVLLPELAASLGTPRFLNEIRIAASLSHPHIVPLYDSGDANGFLFYVMPLVRGPSLRGVLNREHVLAPSRSVTLIAQVADALQYAHQQGVLHRDIKPENILLADGHAYVADFGVAKAVSQAADQRLTRTGFPLGTPGYMSPEQAAGVRELDERSDVYGLGCVLFETLVGDTPGLWLTEEAVRLGRFVDATPAQRERLDAMPGRLEQVLVRALAMRPDDRFPSARDLAAAAVQALDPTPRFGETDVEAILHRALQLQAARASTEEALSLGELEEIAVGVGIPTEFVRRAAEEQGARMAPESAPLFRTTAIRAVIGRAAELHAAFTAEARALSLGAIEQVGAQVGLPPADVRAAAAGAGTLAFAPGDSKPPGFPPLVGPPLPVRVERVVEAPPDPARYPVVVETIQRELNLLGHATRMGAALTWSAQAPGGTSGARDVLVTVSGTAGKTVIQLEERLGPVRGRIGGGLLGAVGGIYVGMALWLAVGMPQAPPLALFSLLCALAGGFLVSGSIVVQAQVMRERALGALADRLAPLVARAPERLPAPDEATRPAVSTP